MAIREDGTGEVKGYYIGPDADLQGAQLMGADLAGVDLHGADLTGAYLMGASLWGADLTYADLRGAKLMDADLQGAELMGADLSGAMLMGAKLKIADLRGAILDGAELSNADFTEASVDPEHVLLIKAVPSAISNSLKVSDDRVHNPGYPETEEERELRHIRDRSWRHEHQDAPEYRALVNANSQRELALLADQFGTKLHTAALPTQREKVRREEERRGYFHPSRRRTPNPGQPPAWGPHHDSYYAHPSVIDHVALRITPAGREHLKNSQGPSFHLTVLERLCEVPSLPQFVLEGELGETVGGEFGERSLSGAMVHSLCEEGLIEAFIEDRPPRPQYVEPYEYNYYDNDLEYLHREMLRRRNPGRGHGRGR